MKNKKLSLIHKIVIQKSTELGFSILQSKHPETIVPFLREDWHLFKEIRSPIAPALELQMSLYEEGNAVRMLLFPSPGIIQDNNINQFIRLSNVANRYLFRGKALGRFWVDEANLDFAYEVILKDEVLEHCSEEVAQQLFSIPYAHYVDLHIPLLMISMNVWDTETAIEYLVELRETGYVDNLKYGLL